MLKIPAQARLGLFVFVLGHLHLLVFGFPLSNDTSLSSNTTFIVESNSTIEANLTMDFGFPETSSATPPAISPSESYLLTNLTLQSLSTILPSNQTSIDSNSTTDPTSTTVSTTQSTFPFDLSVFTMPCGEPSSSEDIFEDDIPFNASCDSIPVTCELTKAAIQAHNRSRPGAMANCMNPTMPVLQPTTVALQNCTITDKARAHKAVVSLHTVSHYMKNLSEVSNSYTFDTQEYTAFYDRIVKDLKGLSCTLMCHNIGLNETDLVTFVRSQLEFIISTLPQNSTETDFTNYHCMFLTTTYETLNKLLNYYQNTCSIT